MPQVNKILKGLNHRFIFLGVLAIIVTAILISRLAQLQLSLDKSYVEAIRKQTLRPIRVPAVRGRIESADGQILVDNKVRYDLIFFLPEFKLQAAGGITRTAEYMHDVLASLAQIFKLQNHISKNEIADMLKTKSQKKVELIENMNSEQLNTLNARALPDFIYVKENKLYLDYSKVRLLERLNSIDQTTENICRQIDRICILIGRPLKDERKKVKRHINQQPALPYRALKDLNAKEMALITEMLPPLNGTTIVADTVRDYPFPMEYSHLLGSTRFPSKVSKEEKDDFHYYLPSLKGISGMEKFIDDELTGIAGRKIVQVNIAGFVQNFDSEKHSVIEKEELDKYNYDPINGNNVILTIDHAAQKLAYDLLSNIPPHLLGRPLEEGEKTRAAFILMECDTGAVKVMVSTPSFDMRRFSTGDKKYFNELYGIIDPENKTRRIHPEENIPFPLRQSPLLNRSLAVFEPGSIIKPLIALAALENNAGFADDYVMQCDGYYKLPNGKKIHCANRYGHGELNLEGAIEQSCNKFFIATGLALGKQKLENILKPAGIGRYPLTLGSPKKFNQEKSGSLLKGKGISLADIAYVSIGQGKITLSPMQAAVFTAAIANGGKVLKPYLIQEIRDSKNEILLEKRAHTRVVSHLPVKTEYIKKIQAAMRTVVIGEYASATNARVKLPGAIELAGKTGTAEVNYIPKDENGQFVVTSPAKYKEENGKQVQISAPVYKYEKLKNTWFIAFAPYDKPKYVAVCFVQGGIYGGTTCASVIREFFDSWEKTKPKLE